MSIQFKQAIVGFVDILGFSNMVAADSHKVENPVYLERISKVISAVSELGKDIDFEIRQFSDSIVTATPYAPENFLKLCELLAELQRKALLEGILLRGGVAFGRHFSDNALMYSSGLINAYNLERLEARFPRIIIDRNLIGLIAGTAPQFFGKNAGQFATLLTDFDDVKFIHYLAQKDIDQYAGIIQKLLIAVKNANGNIVEKYAWLTRYYNYSCRSYGMPEIDFGIGMIKPFTS